MSARPFRIRKPDSRVKPSLPLSEATCPCSAWSDLELPLRIEHEVLTNILENDFPWREVYYALLSTGIKPQQACYSIGGVKELLFLATLADGPLGVNHPFVCRAWDIAVKLTGSYDYLMTEIAIASRHPGFRVRLVDNTEEHVTDEMFERFAAVHQLYFPHSRVWPHKYKQHA